MMPPRKLLIACLFYFCAAPVLAAQPQPVHVGIYLMNLYDLNMDEHSFYADFYIWFKWKGEIDPTEIEFVNLIEKWSMAHEQSGDSSSFLLKDGTNYRIFRVEGRFFHSFSLSRFPLDKHKLDIQIESPEHPAAALVYLPDTNAAEIRNTLKLIGWETKGCQLQSSVHDYGTDFGNPEENAQRYSNLAFTVTLARPLSYFILKMLLPILIVMLVSIGALILHPSYIDTRSSLPIGGLLTAVFLQQSYSDALPDTGYMVLMDKIYLLCYFLISMVLLQVIRAGNDLARNQPEQIIIRRERRLARVFFAIFILGVFALCLW
ncbi:MAG: hypothetical protein KF734_20930 [Saprospiraceae bacterium]|nr:hypothetical protein [Saprospiraceae bacterium]